MPGYLDILQNDPQASACTVDYGPNNSHKITLNIEPSDGRISVFQISYSQAPGMLNFNQNQQEGVFGEDTSPADWISTIPNPWVVTVGSHRTIITCFDINNFPSGTPLCSYDPTFTPFIDSAKFIKDACINLSKINHIYKEDALLYYEKKSDIDILKKFFIALY